MQWNIRMTMDDLREAFRVDWDYLGLPTIPTNKTPAQAGKRREAFLKLKVEAGEALPPTPAPSALSAS